MINESDRRPPLAGYDSEAVAAKWDRYLEAAKVGKGTGSILRQHWAHHPMVQASINSVGGGPLEHWLAEQLPPDCRTVLSIGAGTARIELSMLASRKFERLVTIDVSPESVANSQEFAEELGMSDRVELLVGEFNGDLLQSLASDLDAVVFLDSLHHLPKVDSVLSEISEHLGGGGVVLGDEYVGPNRFSFEGQGVEIAKYFYKLLDEDVRSPWPELPLPDPSAVAIDDPSEAIDSESILPALRRHFPDHTILPIGGGVAYPLWGGLDHDAIFETEAGGRTVGEILALDHRLTSAGIIEPYFCRFVGRQTSHQR